MDSNRRAFLRGTSFGGGSNTCARVNELRPPWVRSPAQFSDNCTRCNRCVSLCPENIIRVGEGGFPRVDFTRGECTFCGDCTSDCEASLFRDPAEISASGWSHQAKISRQCLTFTGVMCRSCEDACAPRAIRFELSIGNAPRPSIDLEACNGCGACVKPCPQDAIAMSTARPAA